MTTIRFGLLSAVILTPFRLAAQQADTVTLNVGSPLVDGRMYKPHSAAVTTSLVRNDTVLQSRKFTISLHVTTRNAIPAFQVLYDYPDDPSAKSEVILDLRTLALVHLDDRDSRGRVLVADVDGRHVTGEFRAAQDSAVEHLDFTLDVPSYYFPFLDAGINATTLVRAERAFTLPTFGFASSDRRTDWHTYRVAARDTLRVRGRRLDAWVIEENWHGRYATRKIWITKELPYLPLVETHYPDGSVLRYEATLLREFEK